MPVVSASAIARENQTIAEGNPDEACAGCHRDIYDRYRKTPMANGSGAAASGFLPAKFTHAASGVSYRIEEESGRVYLDFERKTDGLNVSDAGANALKGRRELKYFLGSGRRGRTYLFEQDGYWFEAPINWYAKKKVWDMAPGYLQAREMPLTLPVDPGCVRCHASGAQPSQPQARNRYIDAPFQHGGITCAMCHGDASAHLASGGRIALAKIGEMEPVKRDSVCLNCHLEGQVAVVRAGKQLVDFRPGDNIFDFIRYYVREPRQGIAAPDRRATSQWEALLTSGCRRGAGAKLTCTSCHDPHGTTAAMSTQQRIGYYREKCLACHGAGSGNQTTASQAGFATAHHPENPDCTSCHMPRSPAEDIAHEQVTDHGIPRVPRIGGKTKGAAFDGELVPVGDGVIAGTATQTSEREVKRDLGLAYAQLAVRGDSGAADLARSLLHEAEAMPAAVPDPELHKQIAFLEQLHGNKSGAEQEYEAALRVDPDNAFAAGNLALIRAQGKQYAEAMKLLGMAFQNDPVQLQAGMNLAILQCGAGKREAAMGTLERILEFSPDTGNAKMQLMAIRANARMCVIH